MRSGTALSGAELKQPVSDEATASRYARAVAVVCVILGLGTGCMQAREGKSFVQECVLPDDQYATITGRWPRTPVPLAIHTGGNFSNTETTAITNAVKSWNDFYKSVNGFDLMTTGDGALITQSVLPVPAQVCNRIIMDSSGEFTGQVVIYKHASWPYDKNVIALTSYCPVQAEPINNIYTGILELNYQHFFVAGKKRPDLESIMLHELGHLMGLDHSCETFSKEGVPHCKNEFKDEYYRAVLFPIILFPDGINGEVRQDLQDNDQGRANCLYEDIKDQQTST